METGKPVTSVITKTFTFPLGTKINDVKVTFDWNEYKLSKKIQPAPEKVPLLSEEKVEEKKDEIPPSDEGKNETQ